MNDYIKKVDERLNVFGDNIAYVEKWDFSRANINDESRIEAITQVASVCYANPKAIGSETLYNRLKAESLGLPSSSFSFVPVLISLDEYTKISEMIDIVKYDENNTNSSDVIMFNIEQFGQWIKHEDKTYLLTNYRALLNDSIVLSLPELAKFYNTEEECKIIAKHYPVFLYKMDMNTSKQHNRHLGHLQELSRRYVSGKKVEFEFYVSDKMKDVVSTQNIICEVILSTSDIHEICQNHYFEALKQGVKAQEARRILPQSMYSTVWTGYLPFVYDNYIALRTDSHSQWEIQQIANAMKDMMTLSLT